MVIMAWLCGFGTLKSEERKRVNMSFNVTRGTQVAIAYY